MHKNIDSLIAKRIVRTNKSFSMIIPKNWVLAHSINPGDFLNMQIKENRIVISIPEEGKNDQ
jgi:antitoxin component of MazEF toxin-antitoxin module